MRNGRTSSGECVRAGVAVATAVAVAVAVFVGIGAVDVGTGAAEDGFGDEVGAVATSAACLADCLSANQSLLIPTIVAGTPSTAVAKTAMAVRRATRPPDSSRLRNGDC